MSETQTGNRAFPPEIGHSEKTTFLTQDEFDRIVKQQITQAPSICPGHIGTVVWYAEHKCYIIQVKMEGKPDIFATSTCTFTPTFGIDRFDGLAAQNIEKYILLRELGPSMNRSEVLQEKESNSVEEYLRNRGIIE